MTTKANFPTVAARGARLLSRIHRRYQTITETVELADLRLSFTRIADPNRVLDEVAEEEDRLEKLSGRRTEGDALHLPYWAELWDSAAGIAQWLIAQRDEIGGRDVLDLGCGMGLSGTVAAALGGRVIFADRESPALLFARLNSLPWRDRVRTRRLDWQRDRLEGESFDLIVGADILYERKQWDFLEPFWRAHLRNDGVVLLGEPGRQTGGMFLDWIASCGGWALTESEQAVATREKPIRIFELRRRATTTT